MTRRTAILSAILVLECVWAVVAYAATPLPPAPSQGWCYDAINADGYYGVKVCGDTPPPPNDPGAYTSLPVTWMSTPPATATTNVTQFFNVFGRCTPSSPVPIWPGRGCVSEKYQDTSAKYLRMRLAMPLNPGTLAHFIKVDSYGTTVSGVKIAVVAPGAAWPTGDATACYVPKAVNNQPAIYINPGAPNGSKCSVPAGSSVDVLVDGLSNGWVGLSWN